MRFSHEKKKRSLRFSHEKRKITLELSMQAYSLTLLVKEKVDEKGRNGLFDDVKKNFSSMIKEDLWGVRSLAYEIKHQGKAFYGYFEFEAEPQAVITLDRNLRLSEDILRYLIIKSKKVKIRKGKAKPETKAEAKTEKVEATEEVKDEKPAVKKEVKSKK